MKPDPAKMNDIIVDLVTISSCPPCLLGITAGSPNFAKLLYHSCLSVTQFYYLGLFFIFPLKQGPTFSVEGQMVSVTTAQLCHGGAKAALDDSERKVEARFGLQPVVCPPPSQITF